MHCGKCSDACPSLLPFVRGTEAQTDDRLARSYTPGQGELASTTIPRCCGIQTSEAPEGQTKVVGLPAGQWGLSAP